jgi:hypothetical protein
MKEHIMALKGVFILSSEKQDYQNYHVHEHTGLTTCNDGHCHIHPGVTSIQIQHGTSHYHEIVGATTYQDGHFHVYRTNTGLAAPLSGGYHTHYASFATSFVDGHIHNAALYVMAVQDN